MAEEELIGLSSITASSQDTADGCAVSTACAPTNVKQIAPDAEGLDLLKPMVFPLDPSTGLVADWSAVGLFSVSSFSILYGPLGYTFDGQRLLHVVTLINPITQTTLEASKLGFIECTSAPVNDSLSTIRYDTCSFQQSLAPLGTFDSWGGVNFTWELSIDYRHQQDQQYQCQMNVNEITLYGNQTSAATSGSASSKLGVGGVVAITLCALVTVSASWLNGVFLSVYAGYSYFRSVSIVQERFPFFARYFAGFIVVFITLQLSSGITVIIFAILAFQLGIAGFAAASLLDLIFLSLFVNHLSSTAVADQVDVRFKIVSKYGIVAVLFSLLSSTLFVVYFVTLEEDWYFGVLLCFSGILFALGAMKAALNCDSMQRASKIDSFDWKRVLSAEKQ
ncbi:hypothetical protein HDU83_008424 [Entophlyctis luteolus]|nr:hypothetical protein HDU83_008424 [Entophlyctis luteolus]